MVGTIRTDRVGKSTELSWTVAPEKRGRGFGKEMVAVFTSQIIDPIQAEIKIGNMASIRIAEYSGMKIESEKSGILTYYRAMIKSPKTSK